MKEGTYNKFIGLRAASRNIMNYLFDNAPELWKLLYYNTSDALSQPDLSDDQKRAMICKNPSVEDTSMFNILFQTEIDDGLSIGISQLRIELGEIYPKNPHEACVEINFQIVVPNKLKLITSRYSDVDDRTVAIFQVLADALNGTQIIGLNSPMFLNKQADYGRRTGAQREKQNKNYSGYWVTFAALC